MALSDIPSKIIEKAGTLSEKKMEIAFNLTQLIHKENKDEKKVIATFSNCLDLIKEFLPQDQATHIVPPAARRQWYRQKNRALIIGGLAVILLSVILYILIHFVGLSLLQLLGLSIAKNAPAS